MARFIRKTVILAKIETAYGQDANPSGAANAMLVSNLSINPLNAQNVDRAVIRKYFGASESLVGSNFVEMGFDVELVGSGTAGTAPAWGPLMRAIGFAETITAGVRVDYTPISDNPESATIYWYDDGVLHKGLGVHGTATMDLSVGQIPKVSFKFVALNGGVVEANPAGTNLAAWRIPQTVIDANSGDLTLGATHAAVVAPALNGGTPYPSQGLTVDLGVSAQFQPVLGGESVEIDGRTVTGAVKLKLTAAQEVALYDDVLKTTKRSFGLVHGTVANDKVLVFMPAVQLTEPTKEELNGTRYIGYKLRATPVSGDDEIRIVTSF